MQKSRILSIFQQCVKIFILNVTSLLNNKIYTLSISLVKIYEKMTKLCLIFNQDNTPSPFLNVLTVVFTAATAGYTQAVGTTTSSQFVIALTLFCCF